MKISRRVFLLGSAVSAACGRRRATVFPGYAFVANQGEKSVAAVDLTRFSMAREIRLEAAPSALMADSSRGAVYVLAPENGTVYEIDAARLELKRKLTLGSPALSWRMAPAGGSLWLLSRSPHALVQVDLSRLQVKTRLRLPAAPEDFDLNREAPLAAVSFLDMQSVAVIDLGKTAIERVVAAGPDPRSVRFRSDGRQM
jgi:hypothetical protein